MDGGCLCMERFSAVCKGFHCSMVTDETRGRNQEQNLRLRVWRKRTDKDLY